MFGDGAIHGELETMLRHLLRGTLGYVGFRVLEPFVGFHIPYISAEERDAVMESFRDDVRRIDQRKALAFPSLTQFDEQLHPLSATHDA
jgi:NAD(P)H dehydrogenase (quinone)